MLDKTLNIAGVLPPGFHFPDQTDIWFPANTIFPETESRSAHNYRVVGRLKPDATLEQAQAQMTAIGARLEQQYPDSNTGKSVAVSPHARRYGRQRPARPSTCCWARWRWCC